MPIDIRDTHLVLGIAGAGAMGKGIAQLAAQAGIRCLLYDLQPGLAAQARDTVAARLDALCATGALGRTEADTALACLAAVPHLGDLAPSHLLIEAIDEKLEAKRQLFATLDEIVAPDAVLATNTASLSVTAIAAACGNPGRVAGCHFFHPVSEVRLAEVVAGQLSQPWAVEAVTALVRRLGHTPVRSRDTPGFLVAHAAMGLSGEALRLLQEGIAAVSDIDRVLREAAGLPRGPFELLDEIGLDAAQDGAVSIYRQFFEEPRLRPSPLTSERIAAGLLGRVSGRGFYRHSEGQMELPEEPGAPQARPARVWVGSADPTWRARVIQMVKELGGRIDGNRRPATDALCVVTPLGMDASACCASEGLDPSRTVGLDLILDRPRRRTLMTTPLTTRGMRDAAHGLFAADGTPVTVIRDSPGFIVQRVLAQIVNVACDIAQQGIAAPVDIDRAAVIALGYPRGPLAWGDALGPRNVLAILDGLLQFYGDPRYRPSPWLRRRALLGASLLTAES